MCQHRSSAMELVTSSAVYATIILFLVFFYIRRSKSSNHNSKSPPEAGGAWPILGHLHLLSDKLSHFNLGALADKYGPAFMIRLGVRRVLVVSSWELAKELFTTYDVAISSRPNLRLHKHLGYNSAMFGFTPYGPYWREIRRLANVELLSNSRVEMLKYVRTSELELTTKKLYKVWEQKKDRSGQMLVELKQIVGDMNLNIILRMVCGKRFYGDTEETRQCRQVLRDFFQLSGLFVPADALPYLGWLDLGGLEKRMKDCAKKSDVLVGKWLDEHRQEGYQPNKHQDFIDVMLSLVKTTDFKANYDTDTIIKSTIEALIAGGTDTTSVMIIWAFSLLLNNRHILNKAQQELDQKVGRERRVNESDISNLEYLQAIGKETFRLFPAGRLGGIRAFSEDCKVGGYHIPKGTWLIVNVWKLQRDSRVWDEPNEFKPERFLTTHKDKSIKGQNFEIIPFGAGRRICPGADFGIQMLHLGLANFLQAFDMSTVSDELIDMAESGGMTSSKVTPLDVLIKPRLSPHLY